MANNFSDTTVADTRRQLLSLSACVGVVLIAIVTIAIYGMYRLDRAVVQNEAVIETLDTMADGARVAQVTFKTQVQEWKNTLLRGHDVGDFKAYREAFLLRRNEVQTELGVLATQAGGLGFPTADIQALKILHGELGKTYDAALGSFRADDPLSVRVVDAQVRGRDRPVNEAFDRLVTKVRNFTGEKRSALRADIASVAAEMRVLLWVSLAVGLGVLLLAAFVAIRAIRKY